MNKKLKKELELLDDCDDFIYPDNYKISKENQKLLVEMVEVLSHERFNHEGWIKYDFYKTNACHFLLKLIRNEYS